jgi:hypothetical protein
MAGHFFYRWYLNQREERERCSRSSLTGFGARYLWANMLRLLLTKTTTARGVPAFLRDQSNRIVMANCRQAIAIARKGKTLSDIAENSLYVAEKYFQ